MPFFLISNPILQVLTYACVLKEKLREHYRKVSFVSDEQEGTCCAEKSLGDSNMLSPKRNFEQHVFAIATRTVTGEKNHTGSGPGGGRLM